MWWHSTGLTLQLLCSATCIALAIGLPMAWAWTLVGSRTGVFRWLDVLVGAVVVAAATTPLILHATAWEAAAGKFGWWWWTGAGSIQSLGQGFRGVISVGWIHGIHGAAGVAGLTRLSIAMLPPSVVQSAYLEASPTRAWWRTLLPAALWGPTCGITLVAMLTLTEMTVANLYAYTTIADRFYLYYAIEPDLTSVFWVMVPTLIAIAGGAAVIQSRLRNLGVMVTMPRGIPRVPASRLAMSVATVTTLAGMLLLAGIPVATFLIKLGMSPEGILDGGLAIERWMTSIRVHGQDYVWTAQIALGTGLIATLAGWMLAACVYRRRGWQIPIAMILWFWFCIPGPLVALGIKQFFSIDVPGMDSIGRRTLVPTFLALLPRTMPIAYLILLVAMQFTDASIWDLRRLEPSRTARLAIGFRLLGRPLAMTLGITAIIASGDVAATLRIIPPGVSTVSTRLFGLLHSGARYQEAGLALTYLGCVAAAMAVLWRLGYRVAGGEES